MIFPHFLFRALIVTVISCTLPVAVLAVPELGNPLSTPDIIVLIAQIIRVVLGVLGIVAVLFIIYGGLQMLLSAGSPEKVKKGQDTLIWAVIGIVVILSSYGLALTLFQALQGDQVQTSTGTTTTDTPSTTTEDDSTEPAT